MTSISSTACEGSPTAQLRGDLDRWRARVQAEDPRSPARAAAIEGLLDFAAGIDPAAYEPLERSGEVGAYRRAFAAPLLELVAERERRTAAELRAKRGDAERLRANPWGAYRGLEQTLGVVDTDGIDRAVMVGCGPLPDSLLCLAERTAIASLAGADRDPAAIDEAAELAARLRVGARLELLIADGAELDYGPFGLICVSAFAVPRAAIMDRIAATAAPRAVVVLRDPVGAGTLFFERIAASLPARFGHAVPAPAPPGRLLLGRYVLRVDGAPTSAG